MKTSEFLIQLLLAVILAFGCAGILVTVLNCGPVHESTELSNNPADYPMKTCVFCKMVGNSGSRYLICETVDGVTRSESEWMADPVIWVHRVCCSGDWGGYYMARNSGACDAYLEWSSDVPPVTAGGCNDWKLYCDYWNKTCATRADGCLSPSERGGGE